jgi:hypothetical protein
MANGKTLSGGKRFLLIPFDQGLPPNPPQLTAFFDFADFTQKSP